MKQFTDAELQAVTDKAYDEGVAKGFEQGTQAADWFLRNKAANQRRELRRLNSKLNDIYRGVKLSVIAGLTFVGNDAGKKESTKHGS